MRTAPAKVSAIIALVFFLTPAAAQENLLPPGPGRAEVIAACSDCHGLYAVLYNRRTAQQWRDTIAQMVMEGSFIPQQNVDVMVQYLTEHFGPGADSPPSPPVVSGGASGGAPAAK